MKKTKKNCKETQQVSSLVLELVKNQLSKFTNSVLCISLKASLRRLVNALRIIIFSPKTKAKDNKI